MIWLQSWIMGRLPVLIGTGVVLVAVWLAVDSYGDHRAAEVEARWAAQRQADAKVAADAQAAADATVARQTQAANAAAEKYAHAQTDNARLAGVNADLARRLRNALARDSNPVPAPGADPGSPEPAGPGVYARTVALAAIGFAEGCARSRDDLAAQVNGLIEAWPR